MHIKHIRRPISITTPNIINLLLYCQIMPIPVPASFSNIFSASKPLLRSFETSSSRDCSAFVAAYPRSPRPASSTFLAPSPASKTPLPSYNNSFSSSSIAFSALLAYFSISPKPASSPVSSTFSASSPASTTPLPSFFNCFSSSSID